MTAGSKRVCSGGSRLAVTAVFYIDLSKDLLVSLDMNKRNKPLRLP